MNLIVYPRLSRNSQLAMRRFKKEWGKTYIYRPRKQLIARLMIELQMDEFDVRKQIAKERDFIRTYRQYY